MRRHQPPHVGGGYGRGGGVNGNNIYSSVTPGGRYDPRAPTVAGKSGYLISTKMLLVIALILSILTYFLPEVEKAEQEALREVVRLEKKFEKEVIAVEEEIEKDMYSWWFAHAEQKPPIPQNDVDNDESGNNRRKASEYDDNDEDPTERMNRQSSKWVDGEKKLKVKLQELVKLQAKGEELGVPVATRWVGDDIPAWAGTGTNVDQWKAQIKKRYDEMQKEEANWREMVLATLETQDRG